MNATQIQETARELATEYGYIDREGELVACSGKFAGERYYLPYFYDQVLHGQGESLGDANHTDCHLIDVTANERQAFDLFDEIAAVAVCYRDNGFVSLRELTEAQREALEARQPTRAS